MALHFVAVVNRAGSAMFENLQADLAHHPVLVAGPAPTSQIDRIEAYAGFHLPPSYREFVSRFGAAIVGPYPVYGSGAAEAMGSEGSSVITVTERFRADRWPGCTGALVISMDHAGNAITMDGSGQVTRFDHDTGANELVSESFEQFVDWCLSR